LINILYDNIFLSKKNLLGMKNEGFPEGFSVLNSQTTFKKTANREI
jgi:hypothetical protein